MGTTQKQTINAKVHHTNRQALKDMGARQFPQGRTMSQQEILEQ